MKYENSRKHENCLKLIVIICFVTFFSFGIKAQQNTWAKVYGGPSHDAISCIRQTSDGGYVGVGLSRSFCQDGYAIWILKLDETGNIVWQKSHEGDMVEEAFFVRETADGGYLILGSYGGSYSDECDILLLKLDTNGNLQWQKKYGGEGHDAAKSMSKTSDGGYILSGYTVSPSPDSVPNAWVMTLDESGNIIWQKTYGNDGIQYAKDVKQTPDGGYILAGAGAGGSFWIVKLNGNGDLIWQKAFYDGEYNVFLRSLQQTGDGGCLVVALINDTWDCYNTWIIKIDSVGAISWQKSYGKDGIDEEPLFVGKTADGGYVVCGSTDEFEDIDVYMDLLILKLDASGNIQWQKTTGGKEFNNCLSIQQTADGGYLAAGFSNYGSDGGDVLIVKMDGTGSLEDCSLLVDHDAPISEAFGYVLDYSLNCQNADAWVKDSSGIYEDTTAVITSICPELMPPEVSLMTKLGSPFRIKVVGAHFQNGIRVFINGDEWTNISWKTKEKLVIKGGAALKNIVPMNTPTTFRFVNPDDGETTLTWQWP